MIQDLFEKLSPVNDEDIPEWEGIKKEINDSPYQIVWDASSGLEIYPTVALALGKISDSLSSYMQNAILVMSDYCPNYLSTLKKVYEKLDNRPRYRSIILALFFGQIKSISDLKRSKSIILW